MLTVFAFIENIGFRQIHTWWRFNGLYDFFKGNKEWGIMTRKGLDSKQAANVKPKKKKSDIWKQLKPVGYWSVIIIVPILLSILLISVLMEQGIISDNWRLFF